MKAPFVLAFALGFFILGFEVLCFRLFDVLFDKSFFLFLPLVFFGGSIGAASVPVSSRQIRTAEASGFLFALTAWASAVAVFWVAGWTWPINQKLWCLVPLIFVSSVAWGAASVLCYTGKRPLHINAALAAGGVLGAWAPAVMEHWGYTAGVQLFIFAALLLLALIPRTPRQRAAIAACGLVAVALPILPVDPDPETPALAYFSNSFSQLKVAPAEYRIPAASRDDRRPAEQRVHAFNVYRNHRQATLVFGVHSPDDIKFLTWETPALLMDLAGKKALAIVGSGGGQEILQGQLLGFEKITAIEINPLMVQVSSELNPTPGLGYRAPNVATVLQDGRFYFEHLPMNVKFDVISISSAHNYGSTGSIAFAENYLLTYEAFRAYIRHLSPGGLLIVRNNAGRKWFYTSMHASLIAAARDSGADPVRTVINLVLKIRDNYLVREQREEVVLYKEGGFDQAILQKFAEAGLQHSHLETRAAVPLSTDDHPFPSWRVRQTWVNLLIAMPWCALAFALVVSLFMGSGKDISTELATFGAAAIAGLAYSGLEILAIEQTTRISGLPFYAFCAVLTSILLAGVAGNLLVERLRQKQAHRVVLAAVVLFFLGGCAWIVVGRMQTPLSQTATATVGALLIFPVAFATTIIYSILFAQAVEKNPAILPRLVALNGLGMLLAGVEIKAIGFSFGYEQAIWLVAALYVAITLVTINRRSIQLN